MSLDTHVAVTLRISNSGIARAGYGLIAILTYKTVFPERIRFYTKQSDVISDGFDATSPEAIAAGIILSQSPHPTRIAIIRGTLAPTQRYLLEATASSSHEYEIQVEGEGVTSTTATYTSGTTATVAQIHNGMLTALNAVTGKNYTAAFAPLVFADLVFTADNATETVTFVSPHGLETGDGPFQVSNGGGALPAGYVALTDYWFIKTGASTGQLATSLADALAGTPQPITTDGTGTQTMADTVNTVSPTAAFTVTGDTAGDWFSLQSLDIADFAIQQNHADPGIATDLAAIKVIDSSWYYLHTLFDSDDMILEAAEWVEANGKMYYVASNNSESANTVAGNSDALDDLEGLNYKRTHPMYHSNPAQMAGAALMGRLAALNPGSWSAAYKTLVGVTADTFTETQIVNLDARRANYYKVEGGRSITWEGRVGNTDYLYSDITTGLDWFLNELQSRVFGIFVAKDKVAYTDEDIAELRGAAEGAVLLGKSDAYKLIAPGTPGDPDDPVPTVTFPRVKDIDASARALRQLPDGQVSFRLQGAVHTVDFDVTITF